MVTMKATKSLMENEYFSLFSVIATCHLRYYSLTSIHNGLNIHTWKGKAIPVSDQHDIQVCRWMETKLHWLFTLTLKWVVSFTLQSLGVLWKHSEVEDGQFPELVWMCWWRKESFMWWEWNPTLPTHTHISLAYLRTHSFPCVTRGIR